MRARVGTPAIMHSSVTSENWCWDTFQKFLSSQRQARALPTSDSSMNNLLQYSCSFHQARHSIICHLEVWCFAMSKARGMIFFYFKSRFGAECQAREICTTVAHDLSTAW